MDAGGVRQAIPTLWPAAFRFDLIRASENRHYWFKKYHHICIDGWGIALVVQRLAAAYNALSEGVEPEPEKIHSYTDFISNDEEYLQSVKCRSHEEYWIEKYNDCTEAADFLYACVARTIEHDLPREIDFLRRHDDSLHRIMERVELPDRLAEDLVRFIRQNKGVLPKSRREKEFSALCDRESADIEAIVVEAFEGFEVS